MTTDCSKEVKSIMAIQEQLVVIKDQASQTSTIQCRHKQLNLFDLFDKYGENSIFENSYVSECICNYTRNQNKYENKRLLTALIPKELNDSFENRNGSTYFTGKRFPSTIDLKNIYFFAPYIKKKGIRDLYVVSKIRVGDRYNGDLNETTSDPRLFFEIKYIGQIFPDYTPVHLNIWHTYTSTTLNGIKSELQNS